MELPVLTRETNWAGNLTYQASRVHYPATVEEVRSIVAHAPRIHALGARHAFNDIADSAELISLERMETIVEIDRGASTVTVGGGVRYGDLALALERERLALHNMASLPHLSVAGAIATATHGSGDASGNLATAVASLEIVTSDGDIVTVSRNDDDFAGMVVSLGALGVVTRVTLDVQPSYQMRQEIFEHLSWEVLFDRFDEVMAATDSVSLFTDYGETVNQVWLKSRIDPARALARLDSFLGASPAPGQIHPVASLSAGNCTPQLGVPGPWSERLPHFRLDAIPASGAELQSEYMVPRRFAVDALRTVRELVPVFRPHLWTSEIRTMAADDLWLSPANGTDAVGIHFSWKSGPETVEHLLPVIEDVLAPFEPRPHWGKLFMAVARDLEPRYERLSDFRQLADQMDRRGAFRNAYLERHIFGRETGSRR
jgi:alditol oxidase